jgi:hypothetical protein
MKELSTVHYVAGRSFAFSGLLSAPMSVETARDPIVLCIVGGYFPLLRNMQKALIRCVDRNERCIYAALIIPRVDCNVAKLLYNIRPLLVQHQDIACD